jgi:4'-phosphopantetheinyl transferase
VVYCRTESLKPEDIDAAVLVLSDDERRRHARFAFERDRRDFAIAHALLRRMISAYAGGPPQDWDFVAAAGGKPALAHGQSATAPLSFNLAHTHGLVACAFAVGREVGIDVERVDRRNTWMDLAERYFASDEVAQLTRCNDAQVAARFIEIWTLKEAYVKALGTGLAAPLDAFAFIFGDTHGLQLRTTSTLEVVTGWAFALYAPATYCRMAVAAAGIDARSVCVSESPDGTDTLRPVRDLPLRWTE